MADERITPSRGAGKIRLFLLFEALTFVVAALVHFGVLLTAYRHYAAAAAETVIAVVLLLGLLASLMRIDWTRAAGIVAQAFALLGTCVGLVTIVIGIGPRTLPGIAYHLLIIVVLLWGLVVALRT